MVRSDFLTATWSATSPATGLYADRSKTTPGGDLLARFMELRHLGAGHCEAAVESQEYPWLNVSFRGDHAVVHMYFAEGDAALLGGDGSVAAEDAVEITLDDDESPATFTGEFVLSVDRAEAVLKLFLRGRDAGSLGDWFNL